MYVYIYINCKHMSTYLNHFKSYVSSMVLFHVNSQWVESNTHAFCFHRSQLGAFTALRSPAGGAERDALLRPSQRSGANEGGKVPWRDLLDMAGVGKQRFTHGSRITRIERGKSSNVWAVGRGKFPKCLKGRPGRLSRSGFDHSNSPKSPKVHVVATLQQIRKT